MKTLYIVRHAKSSWDDPTLGDEQRPLMEKGVQRTEKVIGLLKDKDIGLQLIVSSHAVRAYETARLFARGLGYPEKEIQQRSTLYHTSEETILSEVHRLPDEIHSVMMVGHNPGFTQFVNYLTQEEIDWLGTSAVARLDFKTDRWSQAGKSNCVLRFLISPR
jgi:phosphohistidine phosphatase